MLAASAGLNPAQRHGKRSCCRTGSDGMTDVPVQFTVQLQPQPQQIGAGRAEPQSRPVGHGLEQEVLQEPALFGPAPLDAPGDAGAGVAGQSDGVLPVAGGRVVEHYQHKLLDFDEPFEHRPVGKISQGGQRSGMAVATASAAESLPPLVQRRRLQSCNHQAVSKIRGGEKRQRRPITARPCSRASWSPTKSARPPGPRCDDRTAPGLGHRPEKVSQPASMLVWLDVRCAGWPPIVGNGVRLRTSSSTADLLPNSPANSPKSQGKGRGEGGLGRPHPSP